MEEQRDALAAQTTLDLICRCGKKCKANDAPGYQLRNLKCDNCYNRTISTYIQCQGISSSTGETLHNSDLSCLKEGRMMNDKILQHVLLRTLKELTSDTNINNVHLFDTLFVAKLLCEGNENINTRDLNQKSLLLFPIFEENHFSLMAYFRTSLGVDRYRGGYFSEGYFLHLDSYVGNPYGHDTESITKILKKYVKKIYSPRRVRIFDDIKLEVSNQKNQIDCGYYVCAFLKKLLGYCGRFKNCVIPRDELQNKADSYEFRVHPSDINLLRCRIALDLWKSNSEMFAYKIHICEQEIINLEKQRKKQLAEYDIDNTYTTPDFKSKRT